MSDREATRIPWASMAVVATFVSGTLIVPQAFDLLRPAEKERAQQFSGSDLEVDARLWEDPFAAVRRHEAERAERCKNPAAASRRECDAAQREARRSPAALRAHLDANKDGEIDAHSTLLVAVLVPGNPFVGAEEARRRTRFALLSGLQAEGYYSDSAEQIGLLQVPLAPITALAPLTRLNSSRVQAAGAAALATAPTGGDQLQIPYELLSRNRNLRADESPAALQRAAPASRSTVAAPASAPAAASAEADAASSPGPALGAAPRRPYESVVVVWVDEAALPGPRLDGVARLLDTVIACRAQTCPRLAVLGPSSSDGLDLILHGLEAALIRRGQAPEFIDAALANGYRLLAGAHFYSPAATISDEDLPLLRRYSGAGGAGGTVQSVPDFFTQYFTGIVPERARLPAAERATSFTRTIGADSTVAALLAAEVLQRLPGHSPRRVVMLVESDSIYARGLERRMRHLLAHGTQVSRIEQAYFFRGIDGITVRDGAGDRQPPAAAKPRTGGGKGGDSEAAAVEWPEARDQLDYLRRMAEDLKASESAAGGGPIGAIGIFANDVHDKLLVLQALHDTFPDKVFFTTDMDARFVHPRVLPFTRNLVIASSLPLKMPLLLHADAAGEWVRAPRQVQEGTPPFRDVYQTATYLAARLAACTRLCGPVQRATQAAMASPSVYEIGRNGAVAIGGYDGAAQRTQRSAQIGPLALMLGVALAAFGLWVAPATPALRAWRVAPVAASPWRLAVPLFAAAYGLWLGFAAASVAEVAAPGSLNLKGALAWAGLGALATVAWVQGVRASAASMARRLGGGLVAALAIGAAALLAGEPLAGLGEPLGWLNGISGWPSHFLHLLAVLVVLVSLDLYWHRSRAFADDEAAWLGMPGAAGSGAAAATLAPEARAGAATAATTATTAAHGANESRLTRTARTLRHHALLAWPLPDKGSASVELSRVWRYFRELDQPASRLLRVTFWYLVTVVLAGAAFVLFTGRWVPEVPVRGLEHRAIVIAGLAAALAALPALVLAVSDGTLGTLRLLLALGRGRPLLPREVVARFAARLGPELQAQMAAPFAPVSLPTPLLSSPAQHTLIDDWIAIQFVARQTQAIAPWIVAPFLALGLLVVARSRLFDSWAVTWPLAVTAAAYLLALVGLAVALKLGAERLREAALERMRADLRWLSGAGTEGGGADKLVGPLKQLIADVEGLRQGAFAPMLEQPLVASLMVPLGTAGGVQLLDHLLLVR